ncbi:putative transcription factor TGA like domain-containing protein [Rosa chinensis]|uniref:Putative transcription factor TGA like domain-containing protein n=1 Tax=Rosa chinensis TaxID=74649 RepID=A0A2P6R918_ROSCH|nr:protein ZW2 [Rosa chinensis]PRQ42914.1 putative transcription factor TGA like domain-containing protein [Rosa chinensis]
MTSFEAFFEGWLVRQEHYLDELQSAQQRAHEARDVDLRDLVSRVLIHYQQYYEEKSRIAQRDVFLVFSPTWFTSLERALLWIAGFKPGLAFRLVSDSVPDLSADQRVRMTRLIEETRVEERALDDKLAKIHESVAAPPFVDVARRHARCLDGETAEEEEAATRSLKSALEGVLANANLLRTTLAAKLVEMLSGAQAVRFLVAVAQFQLKIRNWGLQRDAAEKQRRSGGGGRR